jgi:CubicO group peptidase (beta-lactamase class C family)
MAWGGNRRRQRSFDGALAREDVRRMARGGELDGHRIMLPESLERCWAEQSFGLDQVTQMTTRFSLGFMLPQPGMGHGPNMKAFGHPGAGGSLGFADPVQKVGFGY